VSEYEEVVKVPEGMGPFEPEYVTVLTGRMRRPESVAEWQQQQAARLAQFKALPAGAAVIALLQAGEDFDAVRSRRAAAAATGLGGAAQQPGAAGERGGHRLRPRAPRCGVGCERLTV